MLERRVRGLSTTSLLFLAVGCVATVVPSEVERTPSVALGPASDSALGRLFGSPGPVAASEFAPLDRSDEGLDARLALAATAESSIDAQTYIWHEDGTGSLLLDELLEAADRGVRVRLLIDGFRLEGNERLDEALDLHPNLELRVFNPTMHRSGVLEVVEVIENLDRLDHRMHNKLFLVDGVAAIFGGRNVGDEYFGLGEEADFRDLDLLACGPVVGGLADSFDAFWNGPWTVPLGDLIEPALESVARRATHERARSTLTALHDFDERLEARRSVEPAGWLQALGRARARMVPGEAQVLHDQAEIERAGAAGVLARAFEAAFAEEPGDALIVTAYLVPDAELLECVRAHVRAGSRVRILTNSYVSTNQPLVHVYYSSSRHDLLAAGVELYELRGDAWSHVRHRSPGSRARKLGLHAKSAVFGDAHVLVGSLNLDPRSMELNTELGVLIESRELAAWVRECLSRELAGRNSWRVEEDGDGGLRWSTLGLVLDEEPFMGAGEHAREWFLRLLPLREEM